MRNRTLALLGLLAALVIAGFLLLDRARDEASAVAEAPVTTAEVEPAVELQQQTPEAARDDATQSTGRAEILVYSEEEEAAQESPWRGLAESVLVFHARDAAGRPVVGKLTVTTRIRSGDRSRSTGVDGQTDGDGRFELRISSSFQEGNHRELAVSTQARNLAARVDLSRSFPPGETDMGELLLTPAPVVAAGRVIDASGRPVAKVWAASDSFATRDADELENELYFARAQTGEDGSFAFYGDTSVARVEIDLEDLRLRAAPVVVPVGSRGIEILAQEPGSVAGQLLLDPGIPARALQFRLSPEGVPENWRMGSFDT